jgi:hypothetical protein
MNVPRLWKIATAVLAGLLIISNLFWFDRMVDATMMWSTRDRQYLEACRALKQAVAILPPMAAGRTREDVLRIAAASAPSDAPFEKEGAHWIGELGFELSDRGELRKVLPLWEPFECD